MDALMYLVNVMMNSKIMILLQINSFHSIKKEKNLIKLNVLILLMLVLNQIQLEKAHLKILLKISIMFKMPNKLLIVMRILIVTMNSQIMLSLLLIHIWMAHNCLIHRKFHWIKLKNHLWNLLKLKKINPIRNQKKKLKSSWDRPSNT